MCMKKYIGITGAGLFALAVIFSSCVSSPDYTPPDYDALLQSNLDGVDKTQLNKETTRLDDSLHNEWHLTDIQIDTKGGVRYRVLQMGSGEKPVLASNILIRYTGILLDSLSFSSGSFSGKAFDSNQAPTQYFPLYNLIAGMQTTLPLLPEGTRVQLFIPSGVGYGPLDRFDSTTGKVVIPKNSILFFDVELLDVSTQ
jgi:FKBP-type peptidyl-prolyl cis-trans isomerase